MIKKSRKELLKTEDAFIVAASDSAAWLQKHRVTLLSVGAVIVLTGAAAWGLMAHRQSTAHNAAELFAAGWKILNAEVVKTASDAKPTAEPPTYATDKDKWTAARTQFEAAAERGGTQPIAQMARLMVVDLSDKLGDAPKAEQTLAVVRKDMKGDDPLAFLPAERVAYLREAQGDKDGAIAALQDIASNDKRFFSDYAQFHQARLYLAKGDTERARGLLEHVEKIFPQSAIAEDVKTKLDELGGKAAETGTPGAPSKAAP